MAVKEVSNFSDIYTYIMELIKVPTSDTTTLNRVKRIINSAYLQKIVPSARWKWLRRRADVNTTAYYSTGTVSVTNASTSVTVSAGISNTRQGYLFKVDAHPEIYRIAQHTTLSATITLQSAYQGDTDTAAAYKIWPDFINLSFRNMTEIASVTTAYNSRPLPIYDSDKFDEIVARNPTMNGRPQIVCVDSYGQPDYIPILQKGIFTITCVADTAASLDKTYFIMSDGTSSIGVWIDVDNDVASTAYPTALANCGRIVEVTGVTTGMSAANVATQVASALNALDSMNASASSGVITVTMDPTVGYVPMPHMGNTGFTFAVTQSGETSIITRSAVPNKAIRYYPAVCSDRTNLQIKFSQLPEPLDNDQDEPMIPYEDRMVLVYGALCDNWMRERNPESAAYYLSLYQEKLSSMKARWTDDTGVASLVPSSDYIGMKRYSGTRFRGE